MKSIDTHVELLGALVTTDYIHGHIRQAIMDVGPVNVVRVIIDNASNCKLMGSMITEEFPNIVWSPCVAHCLDLMVEDIGKLNWVKEVLGAARNSTKYTLKNIRYFVFLKNFILEATCYKFENFDNLFVIFFLYAY